MSEKLSSRSQLDESQVVDYLIHHPDFFERYPKLLAKLSVPHSTGGISLVERQIKVLREKQRELQSHIVDILQAAQDNEEILNKCINLIVCSLDCASLEELTATARDVLQREFKLDAVSFTLFGHWEKVEAVRVYSSSEAIKNRLDCRFPDTMPICGRMDSTIKETVFPVQRIRSGSVALLPLGKQASLGILGLASRDQLHFSPDMGDLFLELISVVMTQMLVKFKDFD